MFCTYLQINIFADNSANDKDASTDKVAAVLLGSDTEVDEVAKLLSLYGTI